jgi:hypothetical protein
MSIIEMYDTRTIEFKLTEVMNMLTQIEFKVKDLENYIKGKPKNFINGPTGADAPTENPWKGINMPPPLNMGNS